MTINSKTRNLDLRLWFMIHRTHDMLKTCEDRVFGQCNITTERYVVLMTIKHLEYVKSHVRPVDVAQWLARNPNSISMIVDRMVKVGLLKRVRDRADRRVVFLIITSKGEEILQPAVLAGLKFIQQTLSHLSYEDK